MPRKPFLPNKHPTKYFKIGDTEYDVPKVVDGTDNTPLPPSVEEAYRRKCIDLVKRTKEVEEANDQARVRKERLNTGIRKLRLERAFLLEMLGKRMKKSGTTVDGTSIFYESESDGSSEGPPTPQERPLRTKKAHRRPIASTPPPADYPSNQQSQPNNYQSMIYEQPSHQHESPYGPQPTITPSNGSRGGAAASPSQQSSLRQSGNPPIQSNSTRGQSSTTGTSSEDVTRSAFSMFLETRYLSQPHKYSGQRSDSDLEALAAEHWEQPEHAASRKMFEEAAAKEKATHERANRGLYNEADEGGKDGEGQGEGRVKAGGASDVEMSDAEPTDGFRSVN